MKLRYTYLLFLVALLLASCTKEPSESVGKELTIFYFNDPHAHIENFSKIKHIIDEERLTTEVIVACGGDIFSGSPVVDYYEDKGFPMIDLMNKTGVDISVLGNHEFDYGQNILAERMLESGFDWVCANVDMGSTGIPQPFEYTTISAGDLEITFLGLIETYGKPDAVIPSTHPLKVQGIEFESPGNVIGEYSGVKELEQSDLYIALTHLGHDAYYGNLGDFQIANQYPYFNLILGGHSSYLIDTTVNNIPVFQAGKNLEYLGKIQLVVNDGSIQEINSELIDLETFQDFDTEMQSDIDAFYSTMTEVFDRVIGYSHTSHERYQLGCFYTDALRERLGVDLTFQNHGGIRAGIDEGDITAGEIYEMDPFNNGTVVYEMTASEIKAFLEGSQAGFYYSGVQIDQAGTDIELRYPDGTIITDNTSLTVGINDYIPAVFDAYFPDNGTRQSFTTAEAIIYYLENISSEVNYPDCVRFFRYQ